MSRMITTSDTDRRDAAVALVREFFAAMTAGEAGRVAEFLSPDITWQNTSLPTLRGITTVTRGMQMFARPWLRFDAVIHHIVSDGDNVLTERTDTLTLGPVPIRFWVCGTFELRDGKIAVWRDHFGWANVARGLVVGLIHAAIGRR